MPLPGGRLEEALQAGIATDEARHEFRPDLVVPTADRRAEAGDDSRPIGAERFHRGDGVLDDAVEGAAPARVRGGNDARLCVGQEDRAAIGRQDADNQARNGRDHRVRLRPLSLYRAERNIDVGGMDLVRRHQLRAVAENQRQTRSRFSSTRRRSSREPRPTLRPA